MEAALNVIFILIGHGCRPGVKYPIDQVRNWLAGAGLANEEIIQGIAEAIIKEWLTNHMGTIQITARGIAAAKRSKH